MKVAVPQLIWSSVDKIVFIERFMKSLRFLGLMALAGVVLHGQPPTTGAQYWSTTQPNCSSLGVSPVIITDSSGTTIGYSCYVAGTFLWLAAGQGWGSSIRVAAPSSGAIGVDYSFYDPSGNNLSLDTTLASGSPPASGNDVNFALYANQPAEVALLGAPGDAPQYGNTQTGSVYAVFYCPDAATCSTVLPQLLYSFLPAKPWSLSVPISWDGSEWSQWSAEGIDDGSPAHLVSFVIYNQGSVASIYTVRIYDSNGSPAGVGTTPVIPSFGTYGDLLSNVIKTTLPSGVFKILIDGGANVSFASVLQFTGDSATSLQVAYDYAPSSSKSSTTSTLRQSARRARVASTPKQVFNTLTK
jgi:hypothetical protein